ncbi:hypothetical protein P5673_028070 [Acropora cervicornis]|uniref:THAP-type domain-containing protein n=1 Tax=Acropora cervicornis TaxID=6130 RepID=A0AAD9PXY9_ACRCE|nr:hypothetical protein P5673_028070 [Acropora cervicornis]
MDGKQQDLKRRKRKPGKRCVVMFCCIKTNADGVSLHQFPADESSGYICSDHFSADSYERFGAKIAGFSSKLVLRKSAIPSNHASPTPKQVNEARRRKRKLPLANKQLRGEDLSSVVTQETYTTPKRQSRALSKLTANRLVTKFDRIREENASIATSSTNTCKSDLDELPDTRNAEKDASRSVKEPVADFRSTANKCTQKDHRRPSCTSLCNTLYCEAPRVRTALTRTIICHVCIACCTHV